MNDVTEFYEQQLKHEQWLYNHKRSEYQRGRMEAVAAALRNLQDSEVDIDLELAGYMFWYGVRFKSESEYADRDGDSIILEAIAEYKAQEVKDDE